jgi:uncharacterized glyoxalase superfamily protein PhnB
MSNGPLAPHYETFKIIPFFLSTDIAKTITFYRDVLHFTLGGVHSHAESKKEGEPTFASLFIGAKADANIYFFTIGNTQAGKAMIGMSLEGLESYHSRLRQEGVLAIKETGDLKGLKGVMCGLEDESWGYRQFDVIDEDGNEVTFFAFLNERLDENVEVRRE